MPTYPRYLTYRQDELEARLRELDPTGHTTVTSFTAAAATASSGSASAGITGRSRLIKSHSCPVCFPDGKTGTCAYTRGGPAWHIFRFTHGMGNGMNGVGTTLPAQHLSERLGNDRASIEAAAKRLAGAAYRDAVQRERKEYFQRASEGGGRKRRPECCQMKADRARALAGRYAVCQRVGNRLLPIGGTHERLEDANAEWRERQDRNLVVACCNRLDRCWEVPRYNPLYAEFDPWQKRAALAADGPPEAQTQAAEAAPDSQAMLPGGFVPTKAGDRSDGNAAHSEDDWHYLPDSDDLSSLSDLDGDEEYLDDDLDENDEEEDEP